MKDTLLKINNKRNLFIFVSGQNNKSSHFHCMKCNFICSDTNKVVAHRRQHSKLEYIRMAGFRKVSNNEKCMTTELTESGGILTEFATGTVSNAITSSITANSSPSSVNGGGAGGSNDYTNDNNTDGTCSGGTVECSYSLKQTHYHCLVCNSSVLSRAQLGSHRHRV